MPITLNSIINQSFKDWECIIIDDASTDNSFAVIEEFQKKDNRIKAYRRPHELKKGANACRNFGFTKSTGLHIKWFDSDDIMLPNHLEISYNTLVDNALDFVIADNLNFDNISNNLGTIYNFDKDKFQINAENFAFMRIGWITDDFLGTRESVMNIKFNEAITTDGDEYNFFVKFLHQSVKGIFLKQVLTHKRIHTKSITSENRENDIQYFSMVAHVKFQTAKDLIKLDNKILIRWFLSGYMRYTFMLANEREKIPYTREALKLICKYYSFSKGCAFIIALFFGNYFNKGYNIMKYARE